MSVSRATYHSKLYRDFQAIPETSPHSRIRHYEAHEREIRQLEENEFFELMLSYSEALFRAGSYAKYKVLADEIIACCMEQNILTYKGQDLFQTAIFRKAVSGYFLMEYEQAVHLFRELIRMNPEHAGAKTGLRRTLYRMKPGPVLNARAVSVLLLLLAALVTAFELMVARHFYASWVDETEAVRIGLFAAGVLVLAGSDLYQHWRAASEASRFVKEAAARKKGENH